MGKFPKAKKHLGQNFLHSPGMLQKLISSVKSDGGQNFLEIGPGTGAMTVHLNSFAKNLLLVELDQDMMKIIDGVDSLEDVNKLNKSFLNLQESQILDFLPLGYDIIGNLPYYITSPCIEHALMNLREWRNAYFMVQKEVAQRILSKPNCKEYGRLSVFCQIQAQVNIISNVPRGCFQPVPNVDSSFIRLTRISLLNELQLKHTLNLVRVGFGQRRKQLLGLLKKTYPDIDWQLGMQKLNLLKTFRAENLSVEHWMKLACWSLEKAC
ncbi:MAG: 16S rRNA (adenine(1518)-N(6)/adenine(1519)-N(6))-dimethyltransferase RsmA [bacterium]|nr:16S rRNA (adenine(1518)-N(6)/adenine(1519)-N(6))-dimethyltransferase RsmA [bacterium]